MKYLPLYYKWAKTGRVTRRKRTSIIGGLCGSIIGLDEQFNDLFSFAQCSNEFWAADTWEKPHRIHGFTPLRQNIVLLLAAMNNEL